MPYVPRHQAQLGRGIPVPGATQGSRDCGPRSWQMGADARTTGKRKPGVRALRRRGHCTGPVPTSMDDAKRALDGLSVPGRTPLRYYRKRKAADVKQAVRKGRPVHLAISYRKWNTSQKQETGDPAFSGAHSVLIFGERRRGHGVEWLLFDPLEDGRRAAISRGPTWRLREHIMVAAIALAGGDRNRLYAGVIGGAHAR